MPRVGSLILNVCGPLNISILNRLEIKHLQRTLMITSTLTMSITSTNFISILTHLLKGWLGRILFPLFQAFSSDSTTLKVKNTFRTITRGSIVPEMTTPIRDVQPETSPTFWKANWVTTMVRVLEIFLVLGVATLVHLLTDLFTGPYDVVTMGSSTCASSWSILSRTSRILMCVHRSHEYYIYGLIVVLNE